MVCVHSVDKAARAVKCQQAATKSVQRFVLRLADENEIRFLNRYSYEVLPSVAALTGYLRMIG
jgi:hypothetical protein